MSKCIFCLEEKTQKELTDEHIIPEALGSQLKMKKASCKSCQEKCNKSFEHRFLKGSNFIALLRSHIGLRGKRNEPIFGFDDHGKILTLEIQPGFPPIRVGIAPQRLERPMQIIFADEKRKPLGYHFLPNEFTRPLLPSLFDHEIKEIPEKTKFLALWADGDFIAANPWRELLEAFVAWANTKQILPLASSIATTNANIGLEIEWRNEYVIKGIIKIGFMYALSQMKTENIYCPTLKPTRSYLLLDTQYPSDFWKNAPLLQWNGPNPGFELFSEHQFNYFLATITMDNCLFVLIQLHNMGLFVVKLSMPASAPLVENTLISYLVNKDQNGKCSLKEHKFDENIVALFAERVLASKQL